MDYTQIFKKTGKFTSSINIVDAMKLAVDKMNAGDNEVSYVHGLFQDVCNRIAQADKKQQIKYPVVALLQDFEETIVDGNIESDLRIILINKTRVEYTPEQRYVENFNTVLLPMYRDLLECMDKVGFIGINITKIDRISAGVGNLFADTGLGGSEFIDAVEINYSIRIDKDLCLI